MSLHINCPGPCLISHFHKEGDQHGNRSILERAVRQSLGRLHVWGGGDSPRLPLTSSGILRGNSPYVRPDGGPFWTCTGRKRTRSSGTDQRSRHSEVSARARTNVPMLPPATRQTI